MGTVDLFLFLESSTCRTFLHRHEVQLNIKTGQGKGTKDRQRHLYTRENSTCRIFYLEGKLTRIQFKSPSEIHSPCKGITQPKDRILNKDLFTIVPKKVRHKVHDGTELG